MHCLSTTFDAEGRREGENGTLQLQILLNASSWLLSSPKQRMLFHSTSVSWSLKLANTLSRLNTLFLLLCPGAATSTPTMHTGSDASTM